MNDNILIKKREMYSMIMAIENDFINCYLEKMTYDDIPKSVIEKVKFSVNPNDSFDKILRGLDLQSYIEIANANILKLNIKLSEKKFLNIDFTKIISIRNKVMHPRPLDFYDYAILKECFNSVDTKILFLKWDNVISTRKLILETPDKLLEVPYRFSDLTESLFFIFIFINKVINLYKKRASNCLY